jgi:hypothetical protein
MINLVAGVPSLLLCAGPGVDTQTTEISALSNLPWHEFGVTGGATPMIGLRNGLYTLVSDDVSGDRAALAELDTMFSLAVIQGQGRLVAYLVTAALDELWITATGDRYQGRVGFQFLSAGKVLQSNV